MKRTLPEGHTVEYAHLRNYHPQTLELEAKGGITVATIYNADNDIVASTTARCSDEENFCKAMGRTISLGRALAILDGTDSKRRIRRRAPEVPIQELQDAAIFT